MTAQQHKSIAKRHLLLARAGALSCWAAFASTASAAPGGSAEQMPPAAALKAIMEQSKRKIETTYSSGGIEGAMNFVRACYTHLNHNSAPNDRARCVSLDLATFYLEQAVEADFRKVDVQMDRDLSNDNFEDRMDKYLPPSPAASDKDKRLANFRMLVAAYRSN